MIVSAIVAVDLDHAIGRDGTLPWHLPADLKRFRRLTLGKPVIMGRKTFASIGHPLAGRTNIVVSRAPALRLEGCEVVASLDAALRAAEGRGDEVVVIGGGEIFRQCVDRLDRVYLTVIEAHVGGDTHFPRSLPGTWEETLVERCPADERNPHPHAFFVRNRLR